MTSTPPDVSVFHQEEADAGPTPLPRTDTPPPSRQQISRLACLPCRQRKVACDRKEPCSNCFRQGQVCRYEPRKRAAATQRFHVTSHYERKIDNMEEQLNQMVNLLGRLTAGSSSPAPSASRGSPSNMANSGPQVASSYSVPSPSSRTASQTPFQGETSLSAQIAFAIQVIQRAVSASPMHRLTTELDDAVTTLRHLVETPQDDPSAQDATSMDTEATTRPPTISLEERPMPPIESVMAALQLMKTNPQFDKVGFHMVLTAGEFMEYMRKVYFPGGGFSIPDFIIVNSGLADIFIRSSLLEEDPATQQMQHQHMKTCESNIEAALSSLPIHMPNSMDNILALLSGVYYGIKTSKTSLAWTLATTALGMCISAGFHRATSLHTDEAPVRKRKTWAFWCLYSVEKGLSLRLGRPSSVSDYDITLPLPELETSSCSPYYSCNIRWIKLSSIQGRVYKMLYSPAALCEPQASRTAWARRLAGELRAVSNLDDNLLRDETPTNSQWITTRGRPVQLVFFSEEILSLTILTHILRALPTQDGSSCHFAPECIAAARKALDMHAQFVETVGPDNGHYIDIYLNWTILYHPFVPFIVVICHVIEAGNPRDLARLDAFVKSLESARQYSDTTAAIYDRFKTLYDVALQYATVIGATPLEDAGHHGGGEGANNNIDINDDNSGLQLDAYSQAQVHAQALGFFPFESPGDMGDEVPFPGAEREQTMEEDQWPALGPQQWIQPGQEPWLSTCGG